MKYTFLTGSYAGPEQPGVCRVSFDPKEGFRVETVGTNYANPSYVLPHPGGKIFYAVEEAERGAVHAGRLNNSLTKVAGIGTEGSSPCHLALSADAAWLYAANYMGGSLAVFALNEAGNLVARTDVRRHLGRGVNPDRQESAHVHFSAEIEGLVYVCDLGMDAIVVYQNLTGALREVGRIAMPAGSGPRHLAHSEKHPDRLYCVAELGNRVFELKREGGAFAIAQSLSTLPDDFAGFSTAAAIHMTPQGDLLMASNRGHDSIAVFPVQPDGSLCEPVISGCVAEPRDFMICGDHVLAASQRDSVICAYRLDRSTLKLEKTGMRLEIGCPVCLSALD